MKKSRLLEIIREEISSALGEAATTYAGKSSIDDLKKDKAFGGLTGDAKTDAVEKLNSGGTVTIGEEKAKKLAEKYQLDEETINEMASINQTVKGLKALGDEENAKLVLNIAQKTLNQFKEDPVIKSDRLSRNLKPDEYPNKKERTVSYSTEFLKNFKKETGGDFNELTFKIEDRWKTEKPGEEKPFKSPGLAANTTDKDAANQITGKETGQRGRKADPNKPEKPASTGKKGRPAGAPKAEKVATRTPGDDGFDKVEYSDVDGEDKEATQNVGSDSTAKELGKKADVSKNPDFDRIRKGLQNKRKNSKDGILSPEDMKLAVNIINTAKDKYKFNTTQVDSLRADIGL
jgi:hypothetical protein